MRRDRKIFRLRKILDPPFTEGPLLWRRIGAGRAMLPPPPLPSIRISKNGWLRVPVGMWAKPSISPLSSMGSGGSAGVRAKPDHPHIHGHIFMAFMRDGCYCTLPLSKAIMRPDYGRDSYPHAR